MSLSRVSALCNFRERVGSQRYTLGYLKIQIFNKLYCYDLHYRPGICVYDNGVAQKKLWGALNCTKSPFLHNDALKKTPVWNREIKKKRELNQA